MAILSIPITKAGNRKIDIDTSVDIPDDMYQMALEEGLKVMLNKGMSKITTAKLEGAELAKAQEAAFTKATENLEALKAGKIKKGRSAATGGAKVPAAVMTEARRLAKEVVKNELRAAGIKISHVPASEITKAANELIASDESYIADAKANIEARTAKVEKGADETETKAKALSFLEKLGGVKVDPKLVAKTDKEKAERKSQLSAKQAGKVAPRKPQAVPAATLQ